MVPLEYLSDDMLFKSHVALTNAQQLHASFEALSVRQRDRSLSWRFHPFEMLDESLSRDQLRDIKSYIRTGLYEESVCAKNVNSSLRVVDFRNRILFCGLQIAKSQELMELCIQGKEYFHRYDQLQLKVCISLAYLGWASVLLTFLVQDRIYEDTWMSCTKKFTKIKLIDKVALVVAAVIFILLTGNFSN